MADFWQLRDGTVIPLLPRTPANSPPDPRFGYDPYAIAARQFAAAEAAGAAQGAMPSSSPGFSALSRPRIPMEMAKPPVGDGVTMPRMGYTRRPMTGVDVAYAGAPQLPSVPNLPPKAEEPFTGLSWAEGRARLGELQAAQAGKTPGVDFPLPGGVKLAPADPNKAAAYQQQLADRKAAEDMRWQAVQGRQREEGYRDATRQYGPQNVALSAISPAISRLSGQMDPGNANAMMGALSWTNPQGAFAYGKWDSENRQADAFAQRSINSSSVDPTEQAALDMAGRKAALEAIQPYLSDPTMPDREAKAQALVDAMLGRGKMSVSGLFAGASDPGIKRAVDAQNQQRLEAALLSQWGLSEGASPWTWAGAGLQRLDAGQLTDQDLADMRSVIGAKMPPQSWSLDKPFTFPTGMTSMVPSWNRDNYLLDYLRSTPNPTVAGLRATLEGMRKVESAKPVYTGRGLTAGF